MKTTVTAVIVLLIFLFGAKLKLIEATSQEWAGGQYQSGYGTDFKITLLAKRNSAQLQVDELWMAGDYFEVHAVKDLTNRSNHSFSRRDTVYITAGITFKPTQGGKMVKVETKKKPAPIDYDGVALVGYSYKGKRKYIEIESFKKLEKIIYP